VCILQVNSKLSLIHSNQVKVDVIFCDMQVMSSKKDFESLCLKCNWTLLLDQEYQTTRSSDLY